MFSKLRAFFSEAFDTNRFVIRIVEGRTQLTKGQVPQLFLSDLQDFVTESAMTTGIIRGQQRETYVRLVFSPDIPPAAHQKLRNIWHAHEPLF